MRILLTTGGVFGGDPGALAGTGTGTNFGAVVVGGVGGGFWDVGLDFREEDTQPNTSDTA